MPKITRICEVCGKEFQWSDCASNKKKNGGRYCSKKCKGIASRLPISECEWCGKEFQQTYNQHMFCSAECGNKSRNAKRKTGKMCVCKQCSTVFYAPKCRSEEAKFCSIACANKWQGRNKIEFICKICGKRYRLSPSRAEQTNPTYCSITCRNNDPAVKKRLLEMNAIQQTLSPNKLEIAGYKILDGMKIGYTKQTMLFEKFVVDAFIPERGLVIQFDGDYWHGNRDKFSNLDARQSKRVALDKSQDAYMRKCGLRILRFWECIVHKSPSIVRSEIESAIQETHVSSTPP